MSDLLNNVYLLYFVVFLAVTNILGYLVTNQIRGLTFFILVSLLTFQFSKNMIVVLLVALFTTNILVAYSFIREGLENKENMVEEEIVEDEIIEEDKLENIDPELKRGLDSLKETDNIEEAKEMLKYDIPQNNDIPLIVDPNNPDMNKNIVEEGSPMGVELTNSYENLDENPNNVIEKLKETTNNLNQLYQIVKKYEPNKEAVETFRVRGYSTQKFGGYQKYPVRKYVM
jgi:hypothetical protein